MRLVPPRVASLITSILATTVIVGCGGTSSTLSNPSFVPASVPPAANSPATGGSSPGTSASGTASAPSSPAAQAGSTISNIEQMSGWDSCDTCSGGGSISYSMTPGLDYPQPGSTRFSLSQGSAWGHALWWKRLGNDPNPSHFVLTLDEYLESPQASFGVEYDVNQIVDGNWYDFAIQCSFGYGIWQLWDDANQQWVPTSVPCVRPAPSTHSQIRLEFARSNGQALFVSIGVDGKTVPVGAAFNPEPIKGTSGDFGVHIQLNADGNPDPYSLWVHNLELNYW